MKAESKIPLTYTLEFRADEVEEIADVVENKLSTIDVIDREDVRVAARLQAVLDKIRALGQLRERRHIVHPVSRVANFRARKAVDQ